MATVKIAKARNVIWSADMTYVAIIAKHCKWICINIVCVAYLSQISQIAYYLIKQYLLCVLFEKKPISLLFLFYQAKTRLCP